MLRFGETRGELWHIFVEFAVWLANEWLLWAAYHELVAVRLIRLDSILECGLWGWERLEADDGKVRTQGDRKGGEGGLWDGETVQGYGGG